MTSDQYILAVTAIQNRLRARILSLPAEAPGKTATAIKRMHYRLRSLLASRVENRLPEGTAG